MYIKIPKNRGLFSNLIDKLKANGFKINGNLSDFIEGVKLPDYIFISKDEKPLSMPQRFAIWDNEPQVKGNYLDLAEDNNKIYAFIGDKDTVEQ